MTSDSGKWTWDSNITKTFSNNGCRMYASSDKLSPYARDLPTDYEIEATFTFETNNQGRLLRINGYNAFQGTYSNTARLMLYNKWPPNYYVNHAMFALNTPVTIKFRVENGVCSIIQGNTTLLSGSISGTNLLDLYVGAGYVTIKDVKIRAL